MKKEVIRHGFSCSYRIALLAAVIIAGCGKKGPPFMAPVSPGQAFEYVQVSPFRGGVLVSWKGAAKMPPPPAKTGWKEYRLHRRKPGGPSDDIWTVDIGKRRPVRYEYLDFDVKEGVDYMYSVMLVTADGSTARVFPETAVRAGGGPPAPPGIGAAGGDGSVSLSWEPVDMSGHAGIDLAGYNVFRRRGGAGRYDMRIPLNPQPVEGHSFNDMTPLNEQEYCYVLTTVVAGRLGPEESPPSIEVCAVPRDVTPPAAPLGIIFSAGEGFTELSWRENSEEDLLGYRIYRRRGSEGAFMLLTREPVGENRYRDESAGDDEIYFYAVTAVDSSPSANESPYSDIVSVPPAP